MSNVLEADGLSVAYGGNVALESTRIGIRQGELVGVVGANGAGKSTLVNGLVGWSRGSARATGVVRLDGRDISGLAPHVRVREGVLLVPESKLVFASLSVEDNLTALRPFGAGGNRRAFTQEEIYDLFPRLAERRHHLGAQLSGGERQMLGIARALRLAPRALLLDEPSIGLAPLMIETVFGAIKRLAASGIAILLVEQNVRAALEIIDRLILIERGRIVAEGSATAMRDDPRIAEAYLGAHGA